MLETDGYPKMVKKMVGVARIELATPAMSTVPNTLKMLPFFLLADDFLGAKLKIAIGD